MAADDMHQVVDAAIRRTLDAPELQFLMYSVRIWPESWSGDKFDGWWWRDRLELFTRRAYCHATGPFEPDWQRLTRDKPASVSLIRGPTRRTWERTLPLTDGACSVRRSCLHHIEDAPSTPSGFIEAWRAVIHENIAYELTVPMNETTPIEVLTALRDGEFVVVEVPVGHHPPNLFGIRYSGTLRVNRWTERGLWKGYLTLDDDGFVIGLQFHCRDITIISSVGHNLTPPFQKVETKLPAAVDADALVTVGSEVLMPAHPYDIDADVLGPLDKLLDDLLDPHHPGCYPDFSIRVDGAAKDGDAITDALMRAAPRISALTNFGREITGDAERELVDEFEIYTPNYAGAITRADGGIGLYSDWKGEVLPDAANACLAIVVQELLNAGVTHARISHHGD